MSTKTAWGYAASLSLRGGTSVSVMELFYPSTKTAPLVQNTPRKRQIVRSVD